MSVKMEQCFLGINEVDLRDGGRLGRRMGIVNLVLPRTSILMYLSFVKWHDRSKYVHRSLVKL